MSDQITTIVALGTALGLEQANVKILKRGIEEVLETTRKHHAVVVRGDYRETCLICSCVWPCTASEIGKKLEELL